jgi:hypothetical protein
MSQMTDEIIECYLSVAFRTLQLRDINQGALNGFISLVTGNAERRHVPRPGNFVPKRGTGTRRDEAWYDGGTRIGGKQDGRAKVKPRACLGLPLLPPAPAAGAARCRTVRARCPPHRLPLPCARHRSSPSVVARRATCPPPLAAEPPSRVVRLAGVTEGKRLR